MGNTAIDLRIKVVFSKVFRDYYPSLCLLVSHIVKSDEDAEDVVEDLFASLWQMGKSFTDADHLRYFLYRSAKNAALNHIKQKKAMLSNHEAATLDMETIALDCSHAIIRAEVMHQVYLEISQLPTQESKVLSMTLLGGLGVQQIADELGLSLQTVKNCKSRAVAKLRTRFANQAKLTMFLYLFHLFK